MNIICPGFSIEDDINGIEILRRIESAGRTCYKSEAKTTDESCKEFVRKIIASGHHSVLEHEKITVRVICDRGVSHEIVRHRIASYSQESTRYCNYSKDGFGNEITVIDPISSFWTAAAVVGHHSYDNEKYNIWCEAMRNAEEAYLQLIELGATPQEARSVLPNSLKTEIVMTMNLREWRHFFTLRTSKAAHPQMREIAIPLCNEFKRLIPIVFDNIMEPTL